MKVWPAKAANLRIRIGKQTSLQQGIIREIEARDNMTGVKRDLFVFSKEIIRITVEHHFAHPFYRHQIFRDQFRRVKEIKIKFKFVFLRNQL